MAEKTSYRQLEVWHAAVDLAVACYEATGAFPSREMFGLSSQLRRALEIARRLAYLAGGELKRVSALATRVGQMLSALHRSLGPHESPVPSPESRR